MSADQPPGALGRLSAELVKVPLRDTAAHELERDPPRGSRKR